MATTLAVATLATLCILIIFIRRHYLSRSQLPPGPEGRFFLGNLKDINIPYPWLNYTNMAKKFGDVISLRAMGQIIVVVNSARDVREIFGKRGRLCAARMRYVMLEHAGWEGNIHLLPPDGIRAIKRFSTRYLSLSALSQIADAAEKDIIPCVRRLLKHPGAFYPDADLKWMAGGVILRIAYGYQVTSQDDELVALSDAAINTFFNLASPGWILDSFPLLRHLPDWVLGVRFRRTVSSSRKLVHSLRVKPREWAQSQIDAGTALPSLAADILSSQNANVKDTEMLFIHLADLYTAGMDTILAASLKLLSVLSVYPDVQAKAQNEIDNLTHGERLPKYSDRPHLPYIAAMVKELYRFQGIVNMGFPHRVTEDIEYKGYVIPKDSLVCPNIWSIFHNPKKYPDPFTFDPARYLGQESSLIDADPDEDVINEDPTRYIFGFEPRRCVGRHIAETTLFLLVANVVAVCNISDPLNEHGRPITHDTLRYTDGIITRPFPFKCTLRPRGNVESLLGEHDS